MEENIIIVKENIIEGLSYFEISELIENEMENFMHQNPYGDSRDLAAHFFFFGMQYIKEKIDSVINNI